MSPDSQHCLYHSFTSKTLSRDNLSIMIFRSSSMLNLMTTAFSITIHRNDLSSTGTQKATLLYMPTTWQMTPTSFYRTSFDIRPQRSDRHSEIQIRNKPPGHPMSTTSRSTNL